MTEPHWSEVFQNVSTGIAVLAGGGLAIWKWWLEEFIRNKREVPSLDGDLTWRVVNKTPDSWEVTLEALWRNRSAYSISLHTDKTLIKLFEIEAADIDKNRIRPDLCPEREPDAKIYPLKHYNLYWLEPDTETLMREHIVLKSERRYFLVWTIPSKNNPKRYWTRTLMVSTRSGKSADTNSEANA